MLSSVITLVTSADDAEKVNEEASGIGLNVKSTAVWEGLVPPNSYMDLNEYVRMSTPEFFMFRKANELELVDACILFCEMWSTFRTNLTAHNMEPGEVDVLFEPRTSFYEFAEYIKPVLDKPEGIRAYEVMIEAIHHMPDYIEHMQSRL